MPTFQKRKIKQQKTKITDCIRVSIQIDASLQIRTCVRTCYGWPNGFASRLASSSKSQKVVNLTLIQLTCDQLVSTCVGWPNGENLRGLVYERPNSMQVNTSGWPKKTQVENLIALTCVDSVRVRLARHLLKPVTKKQKNWLETDQQVSLP